MEAIDSNPSVEVMPRMLGRYELLGALARGGMATVHLARHRGEAGFQRLFAIKVMHPHLADDEDFVSMLLDEARIAALLHHPNVVPIVDLGSQEGIHYVVMEYVEGCSLAALLSKFRDQRPPRLVAAILIDVLAGLHAAHTLTDDDGSPMHLVHRDVSPQNVMVGIDGTARITDFGIARAESRIMSTKPGQLKGKIAFMSPEQIKGVENIDHRSDLFSAGAMAWSALTGRRLFLGDSDAATLSNILNMRIPAPSLIGFKPPAVFDEVILRALARDPAERFATAQEMEEALREAAVKGAHLGTRREIAAWVTAGFGDALAARRKAVKAAVSAEALPPSGRFPFPSVSSLTPSNGSLPARVSTGPLTPPDLSLLTPADHGGFTPASPANVTPASPANVTPASPANVTPASPSSPTPASSAGAFAQTQDLSPTRVYAEPKSKRGLFIAAGAAVGLLVLLVGAALVFKSGGKSESAEVARPAPAETAAPAAPAPTPVVEPVAAKVEAPAPASSATTGEPEAAGKAGARRWAAAGAVKAAKPELSAKVTPEVAPTPPAAPKEPPKKPALWDKDSPLPPE